MIRKWHLSSSPCPVGTIGFAMISKYNQHGCITWPCLYQHNIKCPQTTIRLNMNVIQKNTSLFKVYSTWFERNHQDIPRSCLPFQVLPLGKTRSRWWALQSHPAAWECLLMQRLCGDTNDQTLFQSFSTNKKRRQNQNMSYTFETKKNMAAVFQIFLPWPKWLKWTSAASLSFYWNSSPQCWYSKQVNTNFWSSSRVGQEKSARASWSNTAIIYIMVSTGRICFEAGLRKNPICLERSWIHLIDHDYAARFDLNKQRKHA